MLQRREARYEAAKFNDRLKSREGAEEVTGISFARIRDIELDEVFPNAREANILADAYNAPELRNWYCRNHCPLGKHMPTVDASDLDRISVRAVSTLRKAKEVKHTLLDIVDDGLVTEEEKPQFFEIIKTLDELSEINENLKVWAEKNLR